MEIQVAHVVAPCVPSVATVRSLKSHEPFRGKPGFLLDPLVAFRGSRARLKPILRDSGGATMSSRLASLHQGGSSMHNSQLRGPYSSSVEN